MRLALELFALALLIAAFFAFDAFRRYRQRKANEARLDRVMSGTARAMIAEMEHGPGAIESHTLSLLTPVLRATEKK